MSNISYQEVADLSRTAGVFYSALLFTLYCPVSIFKLNLQELKDSIKPPFLCPFFLSPPPPLIFSSQQALNDECYFREKYEENHYNTYCSQKHNWYVGLKRNGQPKSGPNTHRGQKAIFFLPRPVGNM